ncbi:28S ribosomal protein S29, mitochondrial [Aplysia californica]|uniref:Small ribosomal subunit protein mS29 n=1 Tax=Aplysia californica TaxID=6500 RepID=A0ABM0ZX99_APLCA|nr:28S ribosomal protein S29, mitochondrial [Aplysia californica]
MRERLVRVAGGMMKSLSRTAYLCVANDVKQGSSRCLSSVAEPKQSNLRQVFRTSEDDPRAHTLDHVGLFYKIPETEVNSMFKGCIHPWHLRLMNTFNEHCLMVRKPSVEVNGYLKNMNFNHPVPKFVYYGRRGAGKVCSLLHTMHFCARNDWIMVHVPWAGQWVRGWNKEVAESTHKPGRFDLPMDAAEWLSHFRIQNQNKLKDLKTTSEYIWTKREKADVGTPLDEIINFGLNRFKFSSDCVGVLLKELRLQAAEKGFKVLVAINSVNSFFVPWSKENTLKNSEKKQVLPHEVSLVHNFKKMLSPTWNNGAVVCTVNEGSNDQSLREDYTPQYLLGQEGFEWFDPFVPILVPEYSSTEALSCLSYYIDRNWIQNEHGRTEEGMKEIMFVSNRNPFNLYKVCSSL